MSKDGSLSGRIEQLGALRKVVGQEMREGELIALANGVDLGRASFQ